MHHNLPRRLYFLQAIEWHVIQVAGTVQVPLLVTHDLLEEVVSSGLPLLFLEQ